MFSAGYLLAGMHAGGLVHGDFHPGNFLFQLDSGWCVPLDSSGGRPVDFTAFHAVYDFLAPLLTLGRDSLSPILLGYGKALSVRSHSSSFLPEEVFALLGVDVDYPVRVDPFPGAAHDLVRCLELEASEGPARSVALRGRRDDAAVHFLRDQPRWVTALALATTILHYDVAALWRHVADRLGPTASSAGAFATAFVTTPEAVTALLSARP